MTHPVWEAYARKNIRILTDLGVDYIKIDFLTHGSAEGDHYIKNVTGRMALNRVYRLLQEEIDACGREISSASPSLLCSPISSGTPDDAAATPSVIMTMSAMC